MGNLTKFLQERFAHCCPSGWQCQREVHVLAHDWEHVLGYSARADVLLTRDDGQRRIWIEFEVSRADPVANHCKFATSHLHQPQPVTDTFVAMVSSHVTRGRRNLAANTILLMRRVGMRAFQTVLLPKYSPEEIKRLNHLPPANLHEQSIDAEAELLRALLISEAMFISSDDHLHYAGDLFEVFSNVHRWNIEIATPAGQAIWGKRTIKYFVYDPAYKQFAPAKFSAYINVVPARGLNLNSEQRLMSLQLYSSLDEREPKFDGNLAQSHLQRQLNMTIATPESSELISQIFQEWLALHRHQIRLHPDGPLFLVAPPWYT